MTVKTGAVKCKDRKHAAGAVRKHRVALEEAVDEHAGNSKLARALGSCDYHTREKGVAALTRFLQRKSELGEKDMLKIWKGLFYAFWHSDKAPVQVGALVTAGMQRSLKLCMLVAG